MNLSIVIPNYNGQDLLKRNLPKVFEAVSLYKKGNVEIIVTDDCSTDSSLDVLDSLRAKIKSAFPSIELRIIKNKKNLGFSSNVDKGVSQANGEILILLNTDVIPQKNFLEPLLRNFGDEKVFAVGCMDKSIENGKIVPRGRGIGEWKRGFLVHARGEVDKSSTLWVNGGSGAFRKSIWDKLGGFNKLYDPFYWEDIDLSYRALKSGYKILFEPKGIVVHEHEKGAIKSTYSDTKIKTIAYRNQIIFVWKNITDFSLLLNHLFWLPYHLISALVRRDKAFFNGLLNAIIVFPQIIWSRQKEQKLFVKTDKEILGKFLNDK